MDQMTKKIEQLVSNVRRKLLLEEPNRSYRLNRALRVSFFSFLILSDNDFEIQFQLLRVYFVNSMLEN